MEGVGRRTQLLDYLRNRRRYWELKEEAENRKGGNDNLSHEHNEEMEDIFRKSMNLLISTIVNDNNNDDDDNNNNNNNNLFFIKRRTRKCTCMYS